VTFNIHGRAFLAFLAAITALPPLAIDMALPSLSLVQAEFGSSESETAAAIAIFLAGFSTAPLAVGPFADRFGRKPVMLAGLAAFTLCGLGCALAPSIGALLAFRLVQGVGAGAVGVLPRAIVRDLFEGHESRLLITTVALVQAVAPVIAPSIGAAVLFVASWQAIYAALAAIGAVLLAAGASMFEESQAQAMRQSLSPGKILASYRRALTNPLCTGFSLVNGLVFAGMFAYINTSPLLFIQGYGVSKAAFAGLFAFTAFGSMIGTGVNSLLVRRHARPKAVLDVALTGAALCALALLAVSLAGLGSTFVVAGIVLVYITTFGLVFPNAAHEAVQPLPDIAGVASAILLSGQMLLGSAGGALGASLYRVGSPLAIGEVMSVAALAAAALYVFWLRTSIDE
jgi:MFS transporter, DHA1 family, multidrug resistance protein